MIPRVLHITPTFNYTCGRSYYHYVSLKHLGKRECYNYLYAKESTAAKRLDDLQIDYSVNSNIGSNNPVHFAGILKELGKIVAKREINILHSYSRSAEIICSLYRKLINSNIITMNTVMSLVNKKYSVEYKSDKIIAISKCVMEQLTGGFKVPASKIELIYNFAEPPAFVNDKESKNGDPFIILSAGRFHPEKNFETLLKAVQILNIPQISVKLVGSGELEKSYRHFIHAHSLNVEIIPSQNDLTDLFINCDICVLPSVVDPLPTFMIQAGFFKRPFVGSDVDGIHETITDGVNGLVFEKENHVQLADKIRAFYADRELRRKCSLNLFELVNRKHSAGINVDSIYKLYLKMLNS